jgi:hypothetical protein
MDTTTLAVVAVILLLAAWYAYESATAAHMTEKTKQHPDVALKFSKAVNTTFTKEMLEALAKFTPPNEGSKTLHN